MLINENELINKVTEEVRSVPKYLVEHTIQVLKKITIDEICIGNEVRLLGFGTFSKRLRKGRIGYNPKNVAEKIEIKPVYTAKFKVGDILKKRIKQTTNGETNKV